MQYDGNKIDLNRLRQAQAPENPMLLEELSVGINFITDFWLEKYLNEYIKEGGSKIKFLTGNSGSGKSHCLNLFLSQAIKHNFLSVKLSAKTTWLHDIKEVYTEVLKEVSIIGLLQKCADKIITELGRNKEDVQSHMTFTDFLASENGLDPLTKREIRYLLNKMFQENTLIDNNFALCCSLLTGGILGHPILEESNKNLLISWLMGEKTAKLSEVRKLGLSPSRISKHNARHMLRSLVEVLKIAGFNGLVIGIDDVEILTSRNSLENIRYTKMRREDAYESVRELIDEIDTLKNVMFIYAFDRELIDDENAGIKSYQALWMRIQNEIEGKRFNRFADIVDLDKLAKQEYGIETVTEMSKRLVAVLNNQGEILMPINESEALEMIEASKFGQSLPRQVNMHTIRSERREQEHD